VDYPEVVELDINPLLAGPAGALALDARIRLDHKKAEEIHRPYSHLALPPYPEVYVQTCTLKDETEILLRPIKPEDEPMWFALLGNCSKETIYSRFLYFFRWDSHHVASRYCFNDYDREIAIVAELEAKGEHSLLGVGRLVADPDHASAEYALLIADDWQNMGLGSLITDHCIEIAEDWGVTRLTAVTTSDNQRMISVFRKRNFALDFDVSSPQVHVSRILQTGESQ
jgi:acetyltransferase